MLATDGKKQDPDPSASCGYGSSDRDPFQNVTDPQLWCTDSGPGKYGWAYGESTTSVHNVSYTYSFEPDPERQEHTDPAPRTRPLGQRLGLVRADVVEIHVYGELTREEITLLGVRLGKSQCCGSESGSTCFWASWIRNHLSEVWIRILLSLSKNS